MLSGGCDAYGLGPNRSEPQIPNDSISVAFDWETKDTTQVYVTKVRGTYMPAT